MSATGSCADNAAAESFFGLLKRERVYRRQYRTLRRSSGDIFDYTPRLRNHDILTMWPAAATRTRCLVESKKNGRTYENTSKVCRNALQPTERTFTLATGRESLDSGMTLASTPMGTVKKNGRTTRRCVETRATNGACWRLGASTLA